MTEKRQKVTKRSNVNARNLLQNSQYSWSMFLFKRSIWVLLELIHRRTQHFTIIDREKHKIEQHFTWNQVTVKIDLPHQYGISVAEEQTSLLVARRGRDGRFCRLHMVRNCSLLASCKKRLRKKLLRQTNTGGESLVRSFTTLDPWPNWLSGIVIVSIYYNFNMTLRL